MELLLAPFLMLAGLLLVGLRRVPEDTALTVRRFGRQLRILTPGLRYTVPMIDRVTQRVRLIGHHVNVPLAGDDSAHAEVYYQILEPVRTGAGLERVDALVSQQASQTLQGLADDSDESTEALALQLKHELNQSLMELGLRVTRCELRPQA